MPEIWFPHLGIKLQKLSRVALRIWNIDIYWYGIILMLGVIAGYIVVYYEAKRRKQNVDLYADFLIYAILFSIIGARIYYVIFSWEQYKDNLWRILNLREGGLAIYGAIIAAIITAFVYTKRRKVNFWEFCDTCMLGLVTGQIIGRWANFINREAFGKYTDSLFAMRYLESQVPDLTSATLGRVVIYSNDVAYVQVTPTFLYESFWNLCVLIILLLYRKKQKFTGEIAVLYLLGYACGRVWIEGLRTDQLKLWHTQIAVSQLLSALIIIVSISFIIYKRNHIKKEDVLEFEGQKEAENTNKHVDKLLEP